MDRRPRRPSRWDYDPPGYGLFDSRFNSPGHRRAHAVVTSVLWFVIVAAVVCIAFHAGRRIRGAEPACWPHSGTLATCLIGK